MNIPSLAKIRPVNQQRLFLISSLSRMCSRPSGSCTHSMPIIFPACFLLAHSLTHPLAGNNGTTIILLAVNGNFYILFEKSGEAAAVWKAWRFACHSCHTDVYKDTFRYTTSALLKDGGTAAEWMMEEGCFPGLRRVLAEYRMWRLELYSCRSSRAWLYVCMDCCWGRAVMVIDPCGRLTKQTSKQATWVVRASSWLLLRTFYRTGHESD